MSCCPLWIAVAFCDPLLKKKIKSLEMKNQKLMDPSMHSDVGEMLLFHSLHQPWNECIQLKDYMIFIL